MKGLAFCRFAIVDLLFRSTRANHHMKAAEMEKGVGVPTSPMPL